MSIKEQSGPQKPAADATAALDGTIAAAVVVAPGRSIAVGGQVGGGGGAAATADAVAAR